MIGRAQQIVAERLDPARLLGHFGSWPRLP